MSKRRNPATCCQGTVSSCCRDARVALMCLIRFRFGKAMGLSGAGPSSTTHSEPQSAVSQSVTLTLLLLLLLLLLLMLPLQVFAVRQTVRQSSSSLLLRMTGTTGSLLQISGAPIESPQINKAGTPFPICHSATLVAVSLALAVPGGPVWRCLLMQLYWSSKVPAPPSTCRVCCPFRQAISSVPPVYWSI